MDLKKGLFLIGKDWIGLRSWLITQDVASFFSTSIQLKPRGVVSNIGLFLEGFVNLAAVKTAQSVKAVRYNMFGFFCQRVGLYCEAAKVDKSSLQPFRQATTTN